MNDNERVRYMRLVLFFDLPTETSSQRRNYNRFRKSVMKEGFIMLQESVYSKMVINENLAEKTIKRVKDIAGSLSLDGLVQILQVTEKQYATMVYVSGKEREHEEITGYEELIII